ncbi:hypothetical protein HWD99_04370 [Microbacterium sp. C5A9]|uniref:hypothetical protein n=1 Tax=Microbacterium sp. C5A9 TaxID=2736663 RepID=UPI001F52A179|nr:hypothetical protein [Microbacterium sp. C5A9]MCI1017854.1 hypothetical protein [Microbacterium sp. C5A9]
MHLDYSLGEDPRALGTYCREVVTQGEFTWMAWVALTEEMRKPPESPRDHMACFAYAQMMLSAVAQISKVFWPPVNKRDWTPEHIQFTKARGLRMRELLKPDPRLKNRAVRDSIEHFDERLDSFFLSSPGAPIADHNIFPEHYLHNGYEDKPYMTLRRIDPETAEIAVLNVKVSLRDLYVMVMEVAARAEKYSS